MAVSSAQIVSVSMLSSTVGVRKDSLNSFFPNEEHDASHCRPKGKEGSKGEEGRTATQTIGGGGNGHRFY